MMSKTHLTAGIATALAVCPPAGLSSVFASVIGGAAGGILCDIECRSNPKMRDALIGRLLAVGLAVILFVIDWFIKAGLCSSILSNSSTSRILGGTILIPTCLFGRFSEHRTFTHSLLYVFLISFGLYCFSSPIGISALWGGLSHLILDTLNKKPVMWLFPIKKGLCFNLCYASKTANTVLMWIGLAVSIILFVWRIID